MPTLVEINGLDEAGRIGENICFVRVGLRIDGEVQLLLRNLDYFGKLIVRKEDLFGREEKNLLRYLRDSLDDPCIDVSIFNMNVQTQMEILKRYLEYLSGDIFRARGVLIGAFQTIMTNKVSKELIDTSESDFYQVTNMLKMYEQYPFLYESVTKSYGMMSVTKKLDVESKLFRNPLSAGSRYMLVVQVDGGYPFVFWWHRFLDIATLTNIKKGNAHFAGVAQGDSYYPAISTAGTLAFVINQYPQRTYFLAKSDIKYDENFPLNEEYYFTHTNSIIRPTFENRLLLIGEFNPELKSCLPYSIHRTDRKRTFEPFQIETSAKSFFDRFGYGKPENTMVVIGRLKTSQQKEDFKFCKEKGYTCHHISDFKGEVTGLLTDVENEIDLLHKEMNAKLSGDFEPIRKKCLAQLS